ncbi:MAG: hypothetical protein SGJ27_13355 [Candidatus Melainabacteria bacterium]|nr:hypothetical protein [Candidatus Melainabacteria bacterium]
MTRHPDLTHCTNCSSPIEQLAKFCGECGSLTELSNQPYQPSAIPLESAFAQAASRMKLQMPNPYHPVASGYVQEPYMSGGVPSGFVQPQQPQQPQYPSQNGVQSGFVPTPPPMANGVPSTFIPPQMPSQNGVPSGFVPPQGAQQNPQYIPQSMSQPLPQQVMVPNTVSYDELKLLEAYRLSQFSGTPLEWKPNPSGNTVCLPPTGGAPTFAQVNGGKFDTSPKLISEMQDLNASIVRERIFLVMHCLIFVVTNIVGLYIALSCYYGCHGDEVTKLVMAFTPLTFINFVALSCLSPIKGTRAEIARLIEKKQYVQFQMEYSNVI